MKSGWIASILLLCLTGISHAEVPSVAEADQLYAQGILLLAQGNPQYAYNRWRAALDLYRAIDDKPGIRKTLISQSKAFEQLGQYRNACTTVLTAFELSMDRLCDVQSDASLNGVPEHIQAQPQGTEGLQALASSLRRLGKLEGATQVLQTLLHSDLSARDFAVAQLELANVQRSQFLRSQNQFNLSSDPSSTVKAIFKGVAAGKSAFAAYEMLFTNPEPEAKLAAQVNWLMLYADLNQWIARENVATLPELVSLKAAQQPKLIEIATQVTQATYEHQPELAALYSRLRVADSLLRLLKAQAIPSKLDAWKMALTQAQLANQAAAQLNHPRARSQAFGLLGQLHLQSQNWAIAWKAFDTARAYAISIRAADLAYQWEGELARLAKRSGQNAQALQFYDSATGHLESVRGDLFTANTDDQLAFQESVTPLYQEYLALLLAQSQPDLERVLRLHEQYQVAELETYLQCGRLSNVSLSKIPAQIRPTTIHVLDLGERIEVIVRSHEGRLKRFTPNTQRIHASVDSILTVIQDQRFRLIESQYYLPQLQALYQELLAPIDSAGGLPTQGTLMFVVDRFMQNLPLTLLHDGKHFLLERYSVTNNIGIQIRLPQPIPRQKTLLFAGLSETNPAVKTRRFSPLPEVLLEAALIQDEVKSIAPLLNQDFTWKHFQSSLSRKSPQIVHISTHGQFSSDPRQTYLLAWDQPLSLTTIKTFFQHYTQQQISPALLFLSACETAKGDRKAALGIAGVTVQAGASSAIASLWKVESNSTLKLSQYFYQAISAGQSRAEALRSAQLELFKNPEYQHPYFWSAYILIGSWL